MFFPQKQERIIPGMGSKSARIAIVGDYTDGFDDRAMRPFSGGGGTVLEQCLHAAGLIKGEVYMTNLFKVKSNARPDKMKGPAPDLFDEKKKVFTQQGMMHLQALEEELESVQANIIVTMGTAPTYGLGKIRSLYTYRGYLFPYKQRKIIPTFHPRSAIIQYTNRHVIIADLKKAKVESFTPHLIRPERQLVYNYTTVSEALEWLEYFENQAVVSFDIEVVNFAVACISFSSDPSIGCVIPIQDRWTEEEELLIWRGVQQVLGNPKSLKVLQNSIFDIQFLLSANGVVVRGPIHDTMIAHSCMYPELPKGLGFLGSIYCGSQAYWKDKVKFDNIKEES